MTSGQIDTFIAKHRLPDSYRSMIDDHFAPLVAWLVENCASNRPTVVGINGAQGSGKSTLADFIGIALAEGVGWNVAVMSIDDFYLTKDERTRLGDDVHPLLVTRGVPGTHDLDLLDLTLDQLRNLGPGEEYRLPRFDKARDDRAAADTWPTVSGPVDLVILEGWCVGSSAQSEAALRQPVNDLERTNDAAGAWRRYVNEQLAGPYADLFSRLDLLVFLQVPRFDAVYRWRLEQERKLADRSSGDAIMNDAQVAAFIQHFERITRANLKSLPDIADVTLQLDDGHNCVRSTYRP
ncbi:MAG: hypothetical protein ACN4GT_13310 [Gammaproteobacteria bacterium]